jgi:hypothetical protein
MSEILVEYETVLRGSDEVLYGARACGRQREDGSWEGWLEFQPQGGGAALVSGRETTQPNRDTLRYWATGLTDPYLDGALLRVQGSAAARSAPRPADAHRARSPAAAAPRAVLDPFHVYGEGADILRSQLAALSADQLRNIARQYHLTAEPPTVLDAMSKVDLVTLIMAAVETRS